MAEPKPMNIKKSENKTVSSSTHNCGQSFYHRPSRRDVARYIIKSHRWLVAVKNNNAANAPRHLLRIDGAGGQTRPISPLLIHA